MQCVCCYLSVVAAKLRYMAYDIQRHIVLGLWYHHHSSHVVDQSLPKSGSASAPKAMSKLISMVMDSMLTRGEKNVLDVALCSCTVLSC